MAKHIVDFARMKKIREGNLVKEIFKCEVMPALGCTEPAAVALACSLARKETGNAEIRRIKITVDPATLKNATGVTIPNTNEKGIKIAAALGAICGIPELKLEVLEGTNATNIEAAKQMLREGHVEVVCNPNWKRLRIAASVETDNGYGAAIIDGNHTNVVFCQYSKEKISFDGIFEEYNSASADKLYADELRNKTLSELVEMARDIDLHTGAWVHQGIMMNLILSDAGKNLGGVGNYLRSLVADGDLSNNLIVSTQILVASATDARMAGIAQPAMSSGGSGNQGILTTLVPYYVGITWGIDICRIKESVALSHLLNSYIKCYLNDLSPMCGCGVAAGVGAAAAITYLRTDDINTISKAINNVIADIAGMLCDGAKGGCSMKGASATEASIRAALLALKGCSMDSADGILGDSFEKTIKNLSLVANVGMQHSDSVVLGIMAER